MTATAPGASSELVPAGESLFTADERAALAGFLAGYSGLTRSAYALDLRQYTSWCAEHGLHLFTARRADIECFGRDMESRRRSRATIARRLCTITGFYRYAVEEELLEHSPAAHVRRPRLDYESHAVGLDRNEVGALLVAAGLGTAAEHALISLLAIQRPADIGGSRRRRRPPRPRTRTSDPDRAAQRRQADHHPLAPRTARAIDLAVGERLDSPILLRANGQRMDGTPPAASSAGSLAAPAPTRRSARTPCGTRSSPPPSTPASPCGMCKRPPHTLIREPPCATTEPASRSTDTPPTSSPPTSPAPPAEPNSPVPLTMPVRHS
jgi:integrase/recombinase XerD